MTRPSPFFHIPLTTESDALAILHLKRDALLPVKLESVADDGYAEGKVTNTRFGSFPHNTLIGLPWGSQVRASKVDTGSRGRKGKGSQGTKVKSEATIGNGHGGEQYAAGVSETRPSAKRKSEEHNGENAIKRLKKGSEEASTNNTTPLQAGSGFIHVLPPTPESWTSSLDHRTQVVYTPDYSYILQRLRLRPGSTLIEAGAGSGSFTHAAGRAVFNGHAAPLLGGQQPGRIYSYEFHSPRVETLRQELEEHGLDDMVRLTHRDVCTDGFLRADGSSPNAEAIFLDLPAPWIALKHLSRGPGSPLNPNCPIHLCTFSPCIEQVIATCSFLRKGGWASIDMVEVQNRRIDVRRERVGLKEEGLRGVNSSAASVDEQDVAQEKKAMSKAERLDKIKKEAEDRKLYKEGRLVHRTEQDVKSHTSYLVFAVLPREWTDEDEMQLQLEYPVDDIMRGIMSQKPSHNDTAPANEQAES